MNGDAEGQEWHGEVIGGDVQAAGCPHAVCNSAFRWTRYNKCGGCKLNDLELQVITAGLAASRLHADTSRW